jgi:hypothetical protein
LPGVGAIAGIAGEESARAVQAIVYNANQHGSGALASAIGVALLLLGAEITQLYATQAGSGVDANELADKTEPAKRKA